MRKGRRFGVCLPLPQEERPLIEEARRRLGVRSWGQVALYGWGLVKEELGLASRGGENGSSE